MRPSVFDLFARSGDTARTKLVVLGPYLSLPENVRSRVSSLNITEHVSPATLLAREISRPSSKNRTFAGEQELLAPMRRWFWARKPDAGFVLADFPATLLQALVFDEWLDARSEALDAVLSSEEASASPVVDHYRDHGLLTAGCALASIA